jgi:hypothetical protein
MGDEWKPSRSKMMVTYEVPQERLVVHVDPSRRGAWRSQPFHAQIKKWAANSPRGHVLDWDGRTIFVTLTNRDINLGEAKDGQHILTRARRTAASKDDEAFLLDQDGPRAKNKRLAALDFPGKLVQFPGDTAGNSAKRQGEIIRNVP